MGKGTETGKMAATHSYLISKQDFFENHVDSVVYGPSTTNNIERWWRNLHERLEAYFKQQLKTLLEQRQFHKGGSTKINANPNPNPTKTPHPSRNPKPPKP